MLAMTDNPATTTHAEIVATGLHECASDCPTKTPESDVTAHPRTYSLVGDPLGRGERSMRLLRRIVADDERWYQYLRGASVVVRGAGTHSEPDDPWWERDAGIREAREWLKQLDHAARLANAKP